MKTRHWLAALAATLATQADVYGLTPPSEDDGPVKVLSCIVSNDGILEAEVDNATDDAQSCDFRCNYDLLGKRVSRTFTVTIPKRFHGRVGQFSTEGATPGNYSGNV